MHTCHLALHLASRTEPGPHLRLISIRVWHAPHSLTLPHISRYGMRHTCWLIHHLRDVVLPPLFSCTYLQGVLLPPFRFAAPNNLRLIYCQMVFNFIAYLCKRPKLLIFDVSIFCRCFLVHWNIMSLIRYIVIGLFHLIC